MLDPFNIKSSNEVVYHYTSIDALIAIMGKSHLTLRATNCLYLNDSNEIIEGINSIKRVDNNSDISEMSFRNYYLTSFSRIDDKLEMWRMYAANGCGVAIGFHLDTIKNNFGSYAKCIYGKDNIDSTLLNFLRIIRCGSSVYFPTKGKPEIIKHTDAQTNDCVISCYIANCISAKNEAYIYEDEVRCFIHNMDNQLPVQFLNRNSIITPYINISVPKDAVKEIIIGPNNKEQVTQRSIMHFLDINGYNNVDVRSSEIPYRG